MFGIIRDGKDMGYAALFMSIIHDYGVDASFAYLETGSPKVCGNRGDYHKWTEDELKEVARLRKNNATWQEIADVFNVSMSSACSAGNKYCRGIC